MSLRWMQVAALLTVVCVTSALAAVPMHRAASRASVATAPATATHFAPRLTRAANDVVYITKTGGCYHKAGCQYLSKSRIKTTRAAAERKGYRACKHCCK